MPFDFTATIIATAVAMSIAGKLAPISQIVGTVKGVG